jgi:hypothetical protein
LGAEVAGYFDLRDPHYNVITVNRRSKTVCPVKAELDKGVAPNQRPRPAVYVIALNATSTYYVGQTHNLKARIAAHRTRKDRPVYSGLSAEAEQAVTEPDSYMGAELYIINAYYTYPTMMTLKNKDSGEMGPPPWTLLTLDDLNNRLFVESTAIRSLRDEWRSATILNAVTSHRTDAADI